MNLVELRAFHGTRRSSVYRSYSLPFSNLRRIRDAGKSLRLPANRSLDPAEAPPLDRNAARQLAKETTSLRRSGELLDLDNDLVAIAALARWCQHERGSWMTIASQE